jgi:hypothetical protein
MLSYIDPILFPDEILVIELTKDRYVYPIYKNGSSGLFEKAVAILDSDEVCNLTNIEVFLREPFERYVSGVQTYLRYNHNLNRETALSLIEEFLFLNRHFALQFHWLVNLQRFVNKDILITFSSMNELDNALGEIWNALTRDQTLVDRFEENDKLHFYLQLDKILYKDFIGLTVTFKDIMVHIHTFYPVLYEEVIERSRDLCAVLD